MIDSTSSRLTRGRIDRRALLGGGLALGAVASGLSQRPLFAAQATPVAPDPADLAAGIVALVDQAMADYQVQAAIVHVAIDGEEVITAAFGESMTGVPATVDMRFRNGAIAISTIATTLLILVDQGVVGLNDPVANWLPELRDADKATLKMLANMTAGYPDYVQDAQLLNDLYANPFRQWTPRELIEISLRTPQVFPPGANWNYSHSNYVILGQVLEAATGQTLADLIQTHVLDPLNLTTTQNSMTAAIPEPALHAFTGERRQFLGIAPGTPFLEESTYWNPSWTLAQGAIQTSDIIDMARTMEAVGTGALLSPESHQAQISPELLGFGKPLAGCATCHTLDELYNYGLGVVLNNDWLIQNPLFFGYGGVGAYLPSRRISLAIATTYTEAGFDGEGNYIHGNTAQQIYARLGAYLAPDSPPVRS